MSKWIEFELMPKTAKPIRKTDKYEVVTKDSNRFLLGYIQWYSPWRCYSFSPSANCVFERRCLKDITDFIEKLMNERKQPEIFKHDNSTGVF